MPAVTESHPCDGVVVGEHRDDDVARARLGDGVRRLRALGGQRVDLRP